MYVLKWERALNLRRLFSMGHCLVVNALAVVHYFAPHFGWSLIPFSANYHGYEGLLITILVPVHTAQKGDYKESTLDFSSFESCPRCATIMIDDRLMLHRAGPEWYRSWHKMSTQ